MTFLGGFELQNLANLTEPTALFSCLIDRPEQCCHLSSLGGLSVRGCRPAAGLVIQAAGLCFPVSQSNHKIRYNRGEVT